MSLSNAVRGMIGEISDNFTKLRTAVNGKKAVDEGQLHNWKQNHRRLVTGLSTSLKIEFPKDMMVAFDDHTPTQPNILIVSPSNLGNRLQPRAPVPNSPGLSRKSRPSSIRDRMQQKKNGGR